jgi:phosphatidylglycerol:prolipoprotein diacylglycerol transferase
MLQTLFYIPNQVFGIPILKPEGSDYGFGLLLLVVLLCGGVTLWNKYRISGTGGDFAGTAVVLAVVCLAIFFVVPKLTDEVGLAIRGYGTMLLIAVVSGVALGMWRARQVGANPEIILSMMFLLFIGGLVGARGLFVMEYWSKFAPKDGSWAAITESAWEIMNVTQGGLVVYGSLIGAAIPFTWYIWRYRLPILPLCDIVVASLLLGQALGRIGCLCNGCCYGSVCLKPELPHVEFPFASPAYRRQAEDGRVFVHGLKLEADEKGRTVVQEVEPGSMAEKQGVQPGQRIAAILVASADEREQTEEALRAVQAGREVSVPWKTSVINPNLEKAHGALFDADGRTKHDSLAISLIGDAGPRVVSWTVEPAQLPHSLPVHPTQVYEAFYAGLMALFAWLYFPFRRRDGEVFALMLTLFPISRFLMEWVRTDEPGVFFQGTIAAVTGYEIGLTISQVISVGLFLSSFAFWWWVLRQPRDSTLKPSDWAPLNAHWAAAA